MIQFVPVSVRSYANEPFSHRHHRRRRGKVNQKKKKKSKFETTF
jgi:hypothetical protein